MEDDLITTKEVGDYRIKVYYCHDSECPITNWGLFGSFFFEYSDMHRLHDECNWKTLQYWGEDSGILIGITPIYKRRLWSEEVNVINDKQ